MRSRYNYGENYSQAPGRELYPRWSIPGRVGWRVRRGRGCSRGERLFNGRISEIVRTYICWQIYESAFLLKWGKLGLCYCYYHWCCCCFRRSSSLLVLLMLSVSRWGGGKYTYGRQEGFCRWRSKGRGKYTRYPSSPSPNRLSSLVLPTTPFADDHEASASTPLRSAPLPLYFSRNHLTSLSFDASYSFHSKRAATISAASLTIFVLFYLALV